jgi:hypothetical protein
VDLDRIICTQPPSQEDVSDAETDRDEKELRSAIKESQVAAREIARQKKLESEAVAESIRMAKAAGIEPVEFNPDACSHDTHLDLPDDSDEDAQRQDDLETLPAAAAPHRDTQDTPRDE